MEIERKFLIENPHTLCLSLSEFEHKRFVQAYISVDPTIRLRQESDAYYLVVKGKGTIAKEEFQLPLEQEQFERLWQKIETDAVEKTRYFIPLKDGLTAELDVYSGALAGLYTVEVEFPSLAAAESFTPPSWFGKDITADYRYRNTALATTGLPENRNQRPETRD